jgi:hypothetical protein
MMFLHGSLCLQLQLDVSTSFPLCIGPARTSRMVKTSSEYCTMVQYLALLRYCICWVLHLLGISPTGVHQYARPSWTAQDWQCRPDSELEFEVESYCRCGISLPCTPLQAKKLDARSLPPALWALSRLGVYHGSLHRRLLARCLAISDSLSAQGVAMTLYSLGTIITLFKSSDSHALVGGAASPLATFEAVKNGQSSVEEQGREGWEVDTRCIEALLGRLHDVSNDLTLQGIANTAWGLNLIRTSPCQTTRAVFIRLAAAAEVCVERTRSGGARDSRRTDNARQGSGRPHAGTKLKTMELAMWLYQVVSLPEPDGVDASWLHAHLRKLLPAAKAALRAKPSGGAASHAQTVSTLLFAYCCTLPSTSAVAGALIDTVFRSHSVPGLPEWLQGHCVSQTMVLRALAASRHADAALSSSLLRGILSDVRAGGGLAGHEPSLWLVPAAKLRVQLVEEEVAFVQSFVHSALERKRFMNAHPPVVIQACAILATP